MPSRTPFAGLERLGPGEPLSSDSSAFTDTNMVVIDKLLQVGAVTHRHTGLAALANPTIDPIVATPTTGGSIPAAQTLTIVYTVVDAAGGETLHNTNPVLVTTQAGIDAPDTAPTLDTVDHAAGTLPADTYYYAVSITDGTGGETGLGPSVLVTVDPGFPNNTVKLKDLTAIVTAAGGTGWRMWRSASGGTWSLLNTGSTDTFNDDGSFCVDSSASPPVGGTIGNTNNTNRLQVTVPVGQPAGTVRFRIYASPDGTLASPCLLGDYPIADAGTTKTYTSLVFNDGSPPIVTQALPGANQIDPDTELLDWHWKRPVANFAALPAMGNGNGDVRVTLDTRFIYIWDSGGAVWTKWNPTTWRDSVANAGALPGGGNTHGDVRVTMDDWHLHVWGNDDAWHDVTIDVDIPGHLIKDEGSGLTQRSSLDFVGAGVTVTDVAGVTTVTVPGGGGGGPAIKDHGAAAFPTRANLNIVGTALAVFDDGVNTITLDSDYAPTASFMGVQCATISNINLASAPVGSDAAFDGVTVVTGDRVLVRSQTSAIENGIYTYQGSGNPMTRTGQDLFQWRTGDNFYSGQQMYVAGGATMGLKIHVISNAPLAGSPDGQAGVVDTDAIHFKSTAALT